MVRHTNKRRNSRRRRQTRGRRTQKGGFSFSKFFGSSNDVNDLREKLRDEKDPTKIAEINKEINKEIENQRHEKTLQEIEKGSSAQSNMGNQEYGNQDYGNQYQNLDSRQSGYSGNSRELDGTRQFGDNNNNAPKNWLSGGSRRRRRRHRRK
jgi:hypothetical protein